MDGEALPCRVPVEDRLPPGEERLLGPDGRLSPGWRVVLVSVLAMIVGPPPVLILSFGLFIPEFQSSFGWSVQAISVGATLISLMLVVIAPLQGLLVDRWGCRVLVILSIPLFGLGVLAMSLLGPHIGWYYAACILMPFAGLGLWPLTYMKMASTWFDRRLGLALGCLNLGNGLGGALVPLLLGLLFSLRGWRAAYVVLGAVNLAVAWPTAILWLRERPELPAWEPSGGRLDRPSGERYGDRPGELFGISFAHALRSSTFWVLAGGFFVIGALSTAFLVHQFNILIEAGVSKGTATLLQAYLGAASVVGQLLAGWLMDRIAAGRVVAAMLLLIALACLAFAGPWAAVLAIPSVTVVGFMIGAEMNILGYLIKRYFGERAFGKLYGVIFAFFSSGGALGAQILAISRTTLHTYAYGLFLIAGLCAALAAMFMRLAPYRFPTRSD